MGCRLAGYAPRRMITSVISTLGTREKRARHGEIETHLVLVIARKLDHARHDPVPVREPEAYERESAMACESDRFQLLPLDAPVANGPELVACELVLAEYVEAAEAPEPLVLVAVRNGRDNESQAERVRPRLPHGPGRRGGQRRSPVAQV